MLDPITEPIRRFSPETLAYIGRHKPAPVKCPRCPEYAAYERPHKAERDTNTAKWRGGFACACGWCDETRERDDDDRHHEEAERFDEFTGGF